MTRQLYYDNPQLKAFRAEVWEVRHLRGNVYEVELDQTAFYPEGGGQPCDQGALVGPDGTLTVKLVRSSAGRILHEGTLIGELTPGDEVEGEVKWPRRQKYMRIHTAGHLLNDVLVSEHPDLVPIKGKHGDKAFLEYSGELAGVTEEGLAELVNGAAARSLAVVTGPASKSELEARGAHVPANLPSDKPLRAIQIGDYPPMPDGGVHVTSTDELGDVVVHHITVEDGKTTIRYGVR